MGRPSRRLLQPGWAGELSDDEYRHIRTTLAKDRKLRARWGFPRGRARLSEELIRCRAMHGVGDTQIASLAKGTPIPSHGGQMKLHEAIVTTSAGVN